MKEKIEKELQEIADYIVSKEYSLLNLPYKIKIHLKDVRGGRARYKTGYISIPLWTVKQGIEYMYYYAIHEVCHFITMSGHTQRFKEHEQKYLSDFGLKPVYAKAYPKKLLSNSGMVVWEK